MSYPPRVRGAGMVPRLVLVQDDEGATWAVGPVGRDESVERLRDLAQRAGYEVVGTALHSSAAAFTSVSRRIAEERREAGAS